MLIDHGSRIEEANRAIEDIADVLRKNWPDRIVQTAHLECVKPTIAEGIQTCVEQGAESIIVHPYFLSYGQHLQKDIPRFIKEALVDFPRVTVTLTEPLGGHAQLVEIVMDRIQAAARQNG